MRDGNASEVRRACRGARATQVYVPLGDLVRALEGRLESDRTRGIHNVFAGRCNWCILAPTGAR